MEHCTALILPLKPVLDPGELSDHRAKGTFNVAVWQCPRPLSLLLPAGRRALACTVVAGSVGKERLIVLPQPGHRRRRRRGLDEAGPFNRRCRLAGGGSQTRGTSQHHRGD